ncbi:MAG: glycosyltransferase [Ktedonobacteraceae bacterium]|nr:glycosyltransferase [Ktedonobacteraceae bacterium]
MMEIGMISALNGDPTVVKRIQMKERMGIAMAVMQKKNISVDTQSSEYIPVRMLEVEIGQSLRTLSAVDEKRERTYKRARCLVRLHSQPLGIVELQFGTDKLSPGECATQIWHDLHTQINHHLIQDGLPQIKNLTAKGVLTPSTPFCTREREQLLANAPFVSVIVPTHDRPDQLTACLNSLLALHYPEYEIIVVDNAPNTNATVKLLEGLTDAPHAVRYVREDRQGPSWARNCGIAIARGEILAFTDDDVVVDSYWLAEMVKSFRGDGAVVCATGLVLPMELDTPAQILFEEVGGYNKGFERRIFSFEGDQAELPMHPYIAERFGTGASMALTAAFIRSVGGFDPALGRVGPVRCSQDIAVFFQVIAQGYKLVYEPASLIYHQHRRDYLGLCKQTYNHSVGYTAYLTKSLTENPHLIFDFIKKVPFALFCTLRARSLNNAPPLPRYVQVIHRELLMQRRKGLLYGPLAYLRSRWEVRKLT